MAIKDLIKDDTDMSIVNYCFKDNKTALTDQQLWAIKETLIKEKVIWAVEQGLGKTYLSIALCNILFPYVRENKMKIVLCVPSNKLEDFRLHLTEKTFMDIVISTGDATDVANLKRRFGKADCIITTPSAWKTSLEFNCLMYNNAHKIFLMIYDEADGVNDKGYMHFIKIARDMSTYTAMANATPIGSASHFSQGSRTGLTVLYNLLYATGRVTNKYSTFYNKYTDHVRNDSAGIEIRELNSDRVMADFGDYFINFNRTDVGASTYYNPCNFHRVVASAPQESALNSIQDGDKKRDILYRPGACANYSILPLQIGALSKLWEVVNLIPRKNNIIIYAKNTDTLQVLRELFGDYARIPTYILDGQHTTTSAQKLEVEQKFNNTPGSIILTNIEKGSNLGAASNIIVYDAPADVLQYIFRGIRGSSSKCVRLDWIYYPKYDEDTMINSLIQMKNIMSLLSRENTLYALLLQELRDVYPNSERLRGM